MTKAILEKWMVAQKRHRLSDKQVQMARELGLNPDKLGNGEHCASTSNRNFEGRQGAGGRTHLVSPAMAAAAAVAGHFVDVRQLMAQG